MQKSDRTNKMVLAVAKRKLAKLPPQDRLRVAKKMLRVAHLQAEMKRQHQASISQDNLPQKLPKPKPSE